MVSEAAIRLSQTVDKDMIICHRALAWQLAIDSSAESMSCRRSKMGTASKTGSVGGFRERGELRRLRKGDLQ